MDEHDALAEILERTFLAGRKVVTADLDCGPDVALALSIKPSEAHEAWQAARAAVAASGRWPVLVNHALINHPQGIGRQVFPEIWTAPESTPDSRLLPADIIAASSAVSSDLALTLWKSRWDVPVDRELIPYHLEMTELEVGRAPELDEVSAAIGPGATESQMERYLLDWELARIGSRRRSRPLESEFVYSEFDSDLIVFLPTPVPWHVPGYLSYHGDISTAVSLCAVLHTWYQEYGAEIRAHGLTWMELIVSRRPHTVDEAWELARAHFGIGPSLQFPIRSVAIALLSQDVWFLHDKP